MFETPVSFSQIRHHLVHYEYLLLSLEVRLRRERRTRDRMVPSSNAGEMAGKFSSPVNCLSWLLYGVRSTPVLPQWHVKYPGHSAKSAGGRLHLNMQTPLTQRSRSGLTIPLFRHSEGTYQEWAHTQLVRVYSATVVSARWATVNGSWPKECNQFARANLHFKNK